MAKIIQIGGIATPFMNELCHFINKNSELQYHLLFCKEDLEDRASHWKETLDETDYIHYWDRGKFKQAEWLNDKLLSIQPELIIIGYSSGKVLNQIISQKNKFNYKICIWNEQPVKNSWLDVFILNQLRSFYYKYSWRGSVDNVFAIGDRALTFYKKIMKGQSVKLTYMPYIQKLSFNKKSDKIDKIRFLYSGRLLKRCNIMNITKAFCMLSEKYSNKFTWCISANGPEKKKLLKMLEKNPSLKDVTFFEDHFIKWEDRLNPYYKSDVLVAPLKHSGWGLVIPEAFSSSMPVISTEFVESARYYLHHMYNGLLVETNPQQIFQALEYFIKYPDEIIRMGCNARKSCRLGDLEYGGKYFIETIYSILQHS